MGKGKSRSESRAIDGKEATVRQDVNPVLYDWMEPIEANAPCGPDLEYDPEFVVLAGRVATRIEAQYGDFVGMPEPVNWSEIDRDCRRLMIRSKDIRLAVLFTRCRARLGGAVGLGEGLELLAAWLNAFSDTIHPQLSVDDDRDAALEIRMNALQALTDIDGLLSDVREIVLTRSTAARLQVRDVERAFAHPRPGDALAPESVTRQLDDLRSQQPAELAGFGRALAALRSVMTWSQDHLDAYQPDFSVLERLWERIVGDGIPVSTYASFNPDKEETSIAEVTVKPARQQDSAQMDTELQAQQTSLSGPKKRETVDRTDALERIREARQWFERHEPSSPVPVLLKQAEHLVGKRYAEVFNVIPAELLAQWDNGE